jgi:hypothetical protein
MITPIGLLRCSGFLTEIRSFLPHLVERIKDFIPPFLNSPSKTAQRTVKWVTEKELDRLRWKNLADQLKKLEQSPRGQNRRVK